MTSADSVTKRLGMVDGEIDKDRLTSCPSVPAHGPAHPPGYPNNMYTYGYWEIMDGVVPHSCRKCDGSERRERAEKAARERAETQRKAQEMAQERAKGRAGKG
jgi:hypothetical protein